MTARSCYTADEVAKILGVAGNTVRRRLRKATEEYERTGKWPENELRGARLGDGSSDKAPWRVQHEDLDSHMKARGMKGLGPPPARPIPRAVA
jgi:hypothetical protein